MKTHDISKLPKWAEQEILLLTSNLEYYKNKAKEIKGEKKTDTYLSQGINEPLPLPNNSHVIFVINSSRSITTQQIQVRVVDNGIEISGCDRLVIKPHASNTCRIESKRD